MTRRPDRHSKPSLALLALTAALVAGPADIACNGAGLATAKPDAGSLGSGGVEGMADARGGAGGTSDARGGAGGLLIDLDAAVIDLRFQGQLCDAKAACEPGDIPISSDDECLAKPNTCYVNGQCDDFVACRRESSGGARRGSSRLLGTHVFFPLCNPGDEQVAFAVRLWDSIRRDLFVHCPPGRECYARGGSYLSVLCMVREGVHCTDPLSCNPGDVQADRKAIGNWQSSVFYEVRLCDKALLCESAADGGVPNTTCFGVLSDGTGEAPDGVGEAAPACCGNGRVDPGETCDVGPLNDIWLDGYTRCSEECQIDGPV